MNYKLNNFLRFINIAHYSRTLTVLILLILLAAIPLTVYIAQKQQELRQRAAEQSLFPGSIVLKKVPDSKEVNVGQSISFSADVDLSNYMAYKEGNPYIITLAKKTPTVYDIISQKACRTTICILHVTYEFKSDDTGDETIILINIGDPNGSTTYYCSGLKAEELSNYYYCGDSASTIVKVRQQPPPTPTPTTPPGCPVTTCRYIRTNNDCVLKGYSNSEWARGTSETGCEGDDCSDCSDVSPECSQPVCIPPGSIPPTPTPTPTTCRLPGLTPDLGEACTLCLKTHGVNVPLLRTHIDPVQHGVCSDKEVVNSACNSTYLNPDGEQKEICRETRGDPSSGGCRSVCPQPPTPTPTQGGPPATPTPTGTQTQASCRVSWRLQPDQPFAPNTDFRAFIKGESSKNNKGDPDWSNINLSSDDGTAAIANIVDDGSLDPLTNCSYSQPCFKSNTLHSLTPGTHTLTFSVQPEGQSRVTCNQKQFETTAGPGTPTVTPTIGPTGTPTPTPTLSPNAARLALTLSLPERSCIPNEPGSGRCIDVGSANPIRTSRPVLVEIFDQNEQKVREGSSTIAFDQTTGLIRTFKGNADIANLTQGTYIVKVKTDKFLKKRIAGIVNITPNTTNQLPPTTLSIGDLNGDNKRDIDDYNTLLNCYGNKANTASCGNFKNNADLNDDGKVDNADYGLFIANFSISGGD